MSRKGKNTYNTTKSNTTPVKPKDPTTARPEQPNMDEPEENDLKNNFKRMFEILKDEMRNSLKEMEKKTNKKLEDISKSLKENQEKEIKHIKETIQDLKTEIETIKKTQAEGIIETEIMRKRSGTTHASLKSRTQEMEERISSAEDTIEEIDLPVKENFKSNKSLIQNIHEIWDTMKRPNLRMIGIEEGDVQLKGTENLFNKIIEENFP